MVLVNDTRHTLLHTPVRGCNYYSLPRTMMIWLLAGVVGDHSTGALLLLTIRWKVNSSPIQYLGPNTEFGERCKFLPTFLVFSLSCSSYVSLSKSNVVILDCGHTICTLRFALALRQKQYSSRHPSTHLFTRRETPPAHQRSSRNK